jgi:hypothetical protein
VTKYYDRITAQNGDQWLVVSTEVNDPQYLTMPFITSTHFQKASRRHRVGCPALLGAMTPI